jgi:hypothetical protein
MKEILVHLMDFYCTLLFGTIIHCTFTVHYHSEYIYTEYIYIHIIRMYIYTVHLLYIIIRNVTHRYLHFK